MSKIFPIVAALSFFALAASGHAANSKASNVTKNLVVSVCPAVDGVPDYNCDGKVVVAFFGDSVTTGYGDTDIGNKEGGYVARAQKLLPNVELVNLSEQGERTPTYMSKLSAAFGSRPSGEALRIRKALLRADYVIQDCGRNDKWYNNAPQWTLANLKFAASQITTGVKKLKKTPPLIITANMTIPDRDVQREWVRSLNRLIARSSSPQAPADLRLDTLPLALLRYDKIHPTSEGYAQLATILSRYLTKTLPKNVKKLVVSNQKLLKTKAKK